MKLSKTLLQAMLLGIAIGSATSCQEGLLEDVKEGDLKPNKERAVLLPHDLLDVEGENEEEVYPENCPACGMG